MTQRARPPRSHGHHTNQLHGQRRKSGIRHQSSMQKVTPGQAVSFVPQHTTRQRSNEPVMPFASPPSSSWQLLCLLMPLHFIALKLHCVQQQRIQPLPVFWLACGLSQISRYGQDDYEFKGVSYRDHSQTA
jgi:hypothetical protein